MRPLKDFSEWPQIAVYDIETANWTDVKLVCHVDEYGNRLDFPSVHDYVTWLFTGFPGQIVWAHAGGKFDHRFLIPEINRRGGDFRAALSGGSIVMMSANYQKKKVNFADSYRLMPDSLKSIGETVNLPKLEVDLSQVATMPLSKLKAYCYRDCDITLKGLQYMRKTLTGVNADFAYTLASVASRWVRRSDAINWSKLYRAVDGKLVYDPRMADADKFAEKAYFGGRTEMFKRGVFKGRFYYYDIVSSYPSSMRFELPLYFKDYIPPPGRNSKSELIRYLSHSGITEATVKIPRMKVAPLCVAEGGRLTFPIGTTRGRWTNIELLAALERGVEIQPHGQARYEGANFLHNFVDTFYNLRLAAKREQDPFRTYAFKILLNSLYGKTVETLDRASYVTSRWEIDRARKRGAQVLSTKIPGVYRLESKEAGPFRHVAAGAYITAYSRLKLLEGLEAALAAGGEVYYCDTDSIITDVPLTHLIGQNLGQWSHEYTFDEMELLLPKVYRARIEYSSSKKVSPGDVIYRCKGVPIVREDEPPDVPELRWNAFKQYAASGDPAQAAILVKDGISGFVQDINAGTLRPRHMPVLRAQRAQDRKREWTGNDSWPLTIHRTTMTGSKPK